jgi:hypothetical protein
VGISEYGNYIRILAELLRHKCIDSGYRKMYDSGYRKINYNQHVFFGPGGQHSWQPILLAAGSAVVHPVCMRNVVYNQLNIVVVVL